MMLVLINKIEKLKLIRLNYVCTNRQLVYKKIDEVVIAGLIVGVKILCIKFMGFTVGF